MKENKCTFAATQVEYLGHIISGVVSTDPKKIKAVMEWPQPTTVKQLRSFLGLAGYYGRFIRGYGSLTRPLTDLLNKSNFHWSEIAAATFRKLKETLIVAPNLTLPDFS